MLKAILFDFNGIIINDEGIHRELITDLIVNENLRPPGKEYNKLSLGKNDRTAITALLEYQGRFINDDYLNRLIHRKAKAYVDRLEQLEQLPIYSQVRGFLGQLKNHNIKLGIVTGALEMEVKLVLERAQIKDYFTVLVTGEEVQKSKPDPEGYLLGVEKMNRAYPELILQPENCLAIEDSLAGILAAKSAKLKVMGMAHSYPLHMLQRISDWVYDRFDDVELDRVINGFESNEANQLL
jgi:HAD superfamily hydrolase (TIGR01509 family)